MAYECIKCMYSEKDISEWPCNECIEILHTRFEEQEKEVNCCECKYSDLKWYEEPCITCIRNGKNNFEKKDMVVHKDNSPSFLPYMMREEEFKIPDSIQIMIDQNKKPNLVIPQLDDINNKVRHTDSVVVGITKTVHDISDSVEKLDKDIPSIADCINIKIDKLMEAVESLDAKINILDQRMHDLRQHQILKDMKCVTQVKEAEKDISSAKEPPKFKVGDIVKVAHDTKHKDFFVCKIKWSERSNRWNYLISLDLEDISGAFWRMEGFLTKSEDYSEPLFKVGDKVKLKHGKVVYDVYSITYFMCNKKKVYRYKIGHGASTAHYENENRLIKA